MADEEVKKETPEEEDKKTLAEWIAEHPQATFITRAIAWSIFAGGLPFAFIAWRYGIFKDQGTIAISGWGILGIVILGIFFFSLANYIRKGMQPGLFKQCASGFCKVILPLLAVLVIVEGIKADIQLFERALGVTIVCELVAIPINPFPEWLEKRQKDLKLAEREGYFEGMWNKFFEKKKLEEEKAKDNG